MTPYDMAMGAAQLIIDLVAAGWVIGWVLEARRDARLRELRRRRTVLSEEIGRRAA